MHSSADQTTSQAPLDSAIAAEFFSRSALYAAINLAHILKLKVVAEGVETEAQHYFLNTVHQCDQFQGYLFSRPLPLEAFEQLRAEVAAKQRKAQGVRSAI